MDTSVAGQFRVEGRGDQTALSYGDDSILPTGAGGTTQNGDRRPDPLRPRSANEDRVEGVLADPVHVHARLERLALAAEGVAAHGHVDSADRSLVVGTVEDPVGEHDHAGTGPVGGHARLDAFAQRLHEPLAQCQSGHGRGLSAGQDQTVHGVQPFGRQHLHRVHAQGAQDRDVLGDVPLQGEDSDGGYGAQVRFLLGRRGGVRGLKR